ncbi:hypothetical protein, partial [Sphingobacterium sp.]|uniref:hypothetical protein n=2 Tax=unclassified Sphingobacterium TaxID=2609468 RepID=UPI00289D1907
IHACHAWGRGFESRPDRQTKKKHHLNKMMLFFCYTNSFTCLFVSYCIVSETMLDLIDQLLCTGHFESHPKVNLWIISLQRTFGIDSNLLILLSIQSTAILLLE